MMPSSPLKIGLLHRLILPMVLAVVLTVEVAGAASDADMLRQGVSSFLKGRFPAAVRTLTALLEVHPKTPFRGMALYYLARAHLKAGNRGKAEELVMHLMKEFPTSFNEGTFDAELLKLARKSASDGEPDAPPAYAPAASAPSVPAKAVQPPLTPAAGDMPAGSRFEFSLPGDWYTIRAGTRIAIPFSIVNRGPAPDRYRIDPKIPPPFAPRVQGQKGKGKPVEITPAIHPGAAFRGMITVSMPSEAVDGFRYTFPVTVTSETSRTVSSRTAAFITAAPLLRLMIAPKGESGPDGTAIYRATIINAGSATADDVSIRLACDPSLEPVTGSDFKGTNGAPTLDGLTLPPGTARTFTAVLRRTGPAPSPEPSCRGEVTIHPSGPRR